MHSAIEMRVKIDWNANKNGWTKETKKYTKQIKQILSILSFFFFHFYILQAIAHNFQRSFRYFSHRLLSFTVSKCSKSHHSLTSSPCVFSTPNMVRKGGLFSICLQIRLSKLKLGVNALTMTPPWNSPFPNAFELHYLNSQKCAIHFSKRRIQCAISSHVYSFE